MTISELTVTVPQLFAAISGIVAIMAAILGPIYWGLYRLYGQVKRIEGVLETTQSPLNKQLRKSLKEAIASIR